MFVWLMPLLLVAFGAVFVLLGLQLWAEYRKVFEENPGWLMSLEVLLTIVRCGTPSVLSIAAMFAGGMLMASGVTLLVMLLVWETSVLWKAIGQTLGL